MNISFIGAGKAGLSLAKYFQSKNHNISFVSDTDIEKATFFKNALKCEIRNMDFLINNSDMVFLTVNDSAIYPLWDTIKKQIENEKTIFIHCSGAKEGFYDIKSLYALHPACPMTGDGFLQEVYFALENEGNDILFIKSFIESLGNKVVLIPKDKKREYHLANVMVSNLVLSLFEKAIKYLACAGMNERDSLDLLMPLAIKNLQNINNHGILASATGPASRGDLEVIKKHMDVLEQKDIELYKNLTQNIFDFLGKNIMITEK